MFPGDHVGDVFEPGAIVRIAHDDAVLRVEHTNPSAINSSASSSWRLARSSSSPKRFSVVISPVDPETRQARPALVAARDAMLARPVPGAIGVAIAVLDFEAVCLSLEVSDNRRTVVRHVIGMDPIEPLLSRREFLGRQRYEIIEARRVVHFTGRNVPLVDSLVDRFHGGRVALLAVAKCLLHTSP